MKFAPPRPMIAAFLLALICNGCGDAMTRATDRSNRDEAKDRPIRVAARTPKARAVSGFPAGAFGAVAPQDRCTALADFFISYHAQYLDGLALSDVKSQCLFEVGNGGTTYSINVVLSRKNESISLVAIVAISSANVTTMQLDRRVEETTHPWNPKDEPYILHVNMSHIGPSLARYLGTD